MLAGGIYDIYKLIRQLPRQDIVVFVMAHVENYEVNGVTHQRTLTNGKKLSKLNLGGLLNYNLYSKIDITGSTPAYKLITNSDGLNEARSPMGVFDQEIDNNLEAVRLQIIDSES